MPKLRILAFIIAVFLCQAATFTVDPAKNAVWHNEQGRFYLNLKYYTAAINEFKTAILLNPESEVSASFYNNLGIAYSKIKDYDSAEFSFKKAVELKPYYLRFRENLIENYMRKNMLEEVVKTHNRLITENPNALQSYIMLGLIHKNHGNKEYAVMYFKRFVLLAPEFGITNRIKSIIEKLEE